MSAELRPEMRAFFAGVAPYLAGTADFDALVASLGPAPSPPARFDFYQRLVAANVRRILKAVFPVLARVVDDPSRAGLAPLPSWRALAADYIAARPCPRWSPNALGEELPDYLASRVDLPWTFAEIADWTLRLLDARRATSGSGRLRAGVSAGSYGFDVARWASTFSAGPAPLPAERAAMPVVLVAYRDPHTLGARVLRPSAAEIVALAIASETVVVDHGFDRDTLAAARANLVSLGLVHEGHDDAPA